MERFLERILLSRRGTIASYRESIEALEDEASRVPDARDFAAALRGDGISLIAEIKRRSPSKGALNPGLDTAAIARDYERGGASALSVLTEPEFFAGSDSDIAAAREATTLPILWKDFVLDRSQIVAARAKGADAVLLIVRILGEELGAFVAESRRWGLCPLVEVFDEADLEKALGAGADVVGVNHRDLETFEEDPTATKRLRPLLPEGVTLVAESAISTRADVESLEEIGVDAMLVGEALVTAPDPAGKIRELLGS